ncbi:MAG TPA: PIG-L deacetylase family protein [Acidimicrobiales bacterium]|nr:PIG-L deacetylase family protein [Acidimicrobiales bacterium]
MNVVAIGAHPDDIEIGCGASLAAHRARGDNVTLLVMTTGEQGPQASCSRVTEQEDAAAVLGAGLVWAGFEDGAVPEGRAAVDVIQSVVRDTGAALVYTHTPRDSHQDHRATAAASLAACRRLSRVLMYEAPTTFNFAPSVFVDVAPFLDTKLEALRAHVSQLLKNGLVDLEALEAQARYRGFQARIRLAEAFEVDRFLWDVAGTADTRPAVDLTTASLTLTEV